MKIFVEIFESYDIIDFGKPQRIWSVQKMGCELQKASFWKRISAWLFDFIITGILAVGLAVALSLLLGYDNYSQTVNTAYEKYEQEYGVVFDISQETYEAMPGADRQRYDAAYDALTHDEQAMYAYSMMLNLILIIASVSILLAMLVWEFAIPLWLGNGRTLGKKIFGLCLVRQDSVKMTTLQLCARTVLGKCTVETLLPVYVLLLSIFGVMSVAGPVILLAVFGGQLLCLALTRNRCAIHDLLAGTVVVDMASQRMFDSTEDLIAYQKKIAAERAARADY